MVSSTFFFIHDGELILDLSLYKIPIRLCQRVHTEFILERVVWFTSIFICSTYIRNLNETSIVNNAVFNNWFITVLTSIIFLLVIELYNIVYFILILLQRIIQLSIFFLEFLKLLLIIHFVICSSGVGKLYLFYLLLFLLKLIV